MSRFHNTLFVTQKRSTLRSEGETLALMRDGQPKVQVPMHHLQAVVCFGYVVVTPAAMHACAKAGVSVVFLSAGSGRFLARIEGPQTRTATLRRSQYAACDNVERGLQLARGFVLGKLLNARVLTQRAARTRRQHRDALNRLSDRMKTLGSQAMQAAGLDALRGVEGEAAGRYFAHFDMMLDRAHFPFEKRSRRPPTNPVNALLSLGYALLANDCIAALEAAGLDPAVGFLHVERSGRPSLALDLMEEFRSVFVDRLVLALLRRNQFKLDDFITEPSGAVRLTDDKRREFIKAYQEQKADTVVHPGAAKPVAWAVVPHMQATLLARAVRGESDYIPFVHR